MPSDVIYRGTPRNRHHQEKCLLLLLSKELRRRRSLVRGPATFTICGECIDLCSRFLEQERRAAAPATVFSKIPTPAGKSSSQLDQYVIGQEHAQEGLSVAVHSQYKR